MANYYVVNNPEGGWKVMKDNAERASADVDTQEEAETIAKELSSHQGGGEVRIQGKDGKFRDSDTVPPGNDPNPPKDTKF